MYSGLLGKITRVNREVWLLLSMFAIAAMLNYALASQRLLLGFYIFPTIFSAYFYGRRHAVLTAVGSVLLVLLIIRIHPTLLQDPIATPYQHWLDLALWAGMLILTAYAMGSLYEHKTRHLAELRETYNGVLLILCHLISKDSYTQNHSYRVSVYAMRIAECMHLSGDEIEDIRAAALLHDIGKIDVSRRILYKAAKLTEQEYEEMSQHVGRGARLIDSVGGSLRRVVPLILAHHDRFDGTGPNKMTGEEIPLGARVIAVADVFDALTSDRPYRKAISPFDAREYITKNSGEMFDPRAVQAFDEAFRLELMDIPDVLV